MFVWKRRRNARRTISFESLEGRLAMSSGMAHAIGPVAAEMLHTLRRNVTGSFKGSTQLVGPAQVVFDNMTGSLGKLKGLTGHGFGFVSGTQFRGASLALSGPGGTLTIDLFQAPIKSGPRGTGSFKSQLVIRNATGSYADAAGSGGSFVVTIQDLKNWYKQTKSLMTDKADVNSLSDAAYFLLNSTKGPKR